MGAVAIAMPRLGMTMEEGTVVEWPIAVGGRVSRGETVLVIETEKAETEVEATVDGVLRHVYVEPGETVPCGALLAAVTGAADDSFDAGAFEAAYVPPDGPAREESASAPEPATPRAEASASGEGRARKAVAPAARALARKLGIDPSDVEGTGPGGRVTKADVEAHAERRGALFEVEPGVGLEVLREGEGDPVALLPGFGTDVSAFSLQTPKLAASFEVIGINPRGVGRSDEPEAPSYAVARAADDVAAVLSAPTHVVGASLGASVALELALRHPERVRSLTLITPFLVASPRLLAFARAWCRARTDAPPESVAEILAPWLFGDAVLGDDATRQRILRGLAQTVRRVSSRSLERYAAAIGDWSGTRADGLSGIDVPTLVLGAEDDLLTREAPRVAEAIPGARLSVIAGAGHALAIDAADGVTEALLAHLCG